MDYLMIVGIVVLRWFAIGVVVSVYACGGPDAVLARLERMKVNGWTAESRDYRRKVKMAILLWPVALFHIWASK